MKAYDLEITGSLITSGSLTVKDNLDVRFQIQLHKEIWNPNKKGV